MQEHVLWVYVCETVCVCVLRLSAKKRVEHGWDAHPRPDSDQMGGKWDSAAGGMVLTRTANPTGDDSMTRD